MVAARERAEIAVLFESKVIAVLEYDSDFYVTAREASFTVRISKRGRPESSIFLFLRSLSKRPHS
jgi:hypothetical protein